MTNKEAAIARISIDGYNLDALALALIDYELEEDDEYTIDNKTAVNKAAVQVLEGMLLVEKVQEGGYSITYSIEGVKARIAYLKGIPVSTPQVLNKSFMW